MLFSLHFPNNTITAPCNCYSHTQAIPVLAAEVRAVQATLFVLPLPERKKKTKNSHNTLTVQPCAQLNPLNQFPLMQTGPSQIRECQAEESRGREPAIVPEHSEHKQNKI